MTQREKIEELILSNKGIIHTSKIVEEGISKTYFYEYVKENKLEKLVHGVYITKDAWVDTMYLIYQRCKKRFL